LPSPNLMPASAPSSVPILTSIVTAYGISKDGKFISGSMQTQGLDWPIPVSNPSVSGIIPAINVYSAFILNRTTNEYTLLDSEGTYEVAFDVDDFGTSAVGHFYTGYTGDVNLNEVSKETTDLEIGDQYKAVWWQITDGRARSSILSSLSEDSYFTSARAIDGAGTRAVGQSDNEYGNSQAVYWDLDTESPVTQAVIIGEPVGEEGGSSRATDISRNGKYIAGSISQPMRKEGSAFIYTDAGGMDILPLIQDLEIEYSSADAYGVSNNGRVVGVNYESRDVSNAGVTPQVSRSYSTGFIYDAANGTRSIAQWLEDSGVDVGGWTFANATAISENGKVVVGTVTEGRGLGSVSTADAAEESFAYIAREGSGAINPESFVNTLSASQSPTGASYNLLNLSLHGAHHVPLQMMGTERHAWVTGDFARYDRYDANTGLAEVGGALDFLDKQLVAGLGVGQSWVAQDLSLGGDMDMSGQYLLGELSFKPTKLPFVFTLTGAIGGWDAEIDRNYVNAGTVDTSSGSTDVMSSTLRFRVDWLDAVKVAGFGITPKIEYTVNRTEADGYTESGGGFPVSYDAQGHTAHEVRYGLAAARTFMSNKALLRLRAEGVHRFDQSGSGTSGQVVGLFNFNLPGQQIQQDWVQLGVDFTYALTQKVTLTSGITTSTSGEDPVLGGSLGVMVKF